MLFCHVKEYLFKKIIVHFDDQIAPYVAYWKKKSVWVLKQRKYIYVYIYIKNIHWAVLSALKELKFVQI